MNYAEYRQTQIANGLMYQDFVVDVLWQTIGLAVVMYSSKEYQHVVGESRTGVEVKHDMRFRTTGNLWIEVAEKARPRTGPYANSGIHRGDNSWLYVIGDYDTIFVFSKRLLVMLSPRYRKLENNTKTSVGFLLPEQDARKYAAAIVEPNSSTKVVKLANDLKERAKELHRAITNDKSQLSLFDEMR